MKRILGRWYVIAGLVIVLPMGFLAMRLLRAEPSNSPRPTDISKATRIARAPDGSQDERVAAPPMGSVTGSGVVEPRDRQTNVGGSVAGRIAKVLVVEGQKVRVGDELLEFDSAIEQAALAAATAENAAAQQQLLRVVRGSRAQDIQAVIADANAARARAQLSENVAERKRRLAAVGGVSPQEIDTAIRNAQADESTALAAEARAHAVLAGSRQEDELLAHAQADAAAARRDQAQATLDRLLVRAPIAGEVLQVLVRAGEYYRPDSDPLIVIGDTSELRVRMDVDERDVGRVKLGDAVIVRANAFPGVDYKGKVVEIGRRMGRKNVRTDEPTERNDTKILEVLVSLDGARGLFIGQRVTCYILEDG
jgi:HlyD family secretion protein